MAIKAFLSYSHDSPEHRDAVLALAQRLRQDGIDCELDRFYESATPPGGWAQWMVRQVQEADVVLVVCSEVYARRFEGREERGRGLGVKWEGAVITQTLYEAELQTDKFLPVVLSPAAVPHIPLLLRLATRYDVSTEAGYETLYRRLTAQPEVRKDPLGAVRRLPVRETRQAQAPARIRSGLPPRNPAFTGRTGILAAVEKTLAESGIAVISALGGVGKTQVAREHVHRHEKDYEAVFWVPSESRESLAARLLAIAEELGLVERSPERAAGPAADLREVAGGSDRWRDAAVAVVRWLEQRSGWLLIFDSADDPEVLADLLPKGGAGHVLVTSRADVFDMLGVLRPLPLDVMSPEEAEQLLLRRTGRAADSGEAAQAREIAAAVGHLPLALEQAAGYIWPWRSPSPATWRPTGGRGGRCSPAARAGRAIRAPRWPPPGR